MGMDRCMDMVEGMMVVVGGFPQTQKQTQSQKPEEK